MRALTKCFRTRRRTKASRVQYVPVTRAHVYAPVACSFIKKKSYQMKLSQNCVFNEFQIQRFKKLWMLATAELSIACRPVINAKDPSAAVLWAFFSLCAFCLWKLFVEVLSSLGSVLKDRGCIIDAKREALWIQNKEGRKYGQDEFLFLVSLKRAFKYIYIFSINWF